MNQNDHFISIFFYQYFFSSQLESQFEPISLRILNELALYNEDCKNPNLKKNPECFTIQDFVLSRF